MLGIKELVGTLLNKGHTAPRESIASVTQLVQNMPETEFYVSFIDVVKAVSRLNADAGAKPRDRLQTLLYVDDRSHAFHEKICRDFLRGAGRSQSQLPSILAYWAELAKGYQLALRQLQTPGSKPEEIIQLATVRALHHQLNLVKWGALRYISADGDTWQQAYHIYLLAEDLGIAQLPIRVYPNGLVTTCEALLIHAAMMHLAQTDNLYTHEIEGIDMILSQLVDGVQLNRQPNKDSFQYVINLEKPQPPQLLRRGTTGNGCRYWSGERVIHRLADMMLIFEQEIPSECATALPNITQHDWNTLLEKLSIRWSQDGGRSMRQHERRFQSGPALVEVGLDRITHALKLQHAQEQFTPSGPDNGWRINDISESGLGLIYLGHAVDNLRLGRMICVSTQQNHNGIGIIRRLQRLAEGGSRIGVELLGHNPIAVTISFPDRQPAQHTASGIYLPLVNSCSQRRMLLLPRRLTQPGQELIFAANGKAYHITILQVMEQYEDFAEVDFEPKGRVQK